jgi:signal transduction histidine kinase
MAEIKSMAHHEISPGQIRGLLLLLVLGPLIPTALMLRLMFVSAENARQEAREQTEQTYQKSLNLMTRSLEHQLETAPPSRADAPEKIARFFDTYLKPDEPRESIRLLDEHGQLLSGGSQPGGKAVAVAALNAPFAGWKVELYLEGRNELVASANEDIAVFAWTAGLAILANVVIAGAAGFAVHRQMSMQELKNSTLATVTHEFKTPLASMRVLLETLLEGRYRSAEQSREYLELAVRENHRLSRLIENFLALSRIERGVYTFRKEPIPPGEIVQAAIGAMNVKMNGGAIESRPGENIPPVLGDRDSLNMALLNLLENAWKYTGEDKRIAVETRRDGGRVVFEVSDNGIGIARAEQANIFKRFYQVDQKLTRSAEGCGLGLSIVKHIVEAHGGGVSVESEPGKGSRFLVSIPVA